jgi:hypothetical protein
MIDIRDLHVKIPTDDKEIVFLVWSPKPGVVRCFPIPRQTGEALIRDGLDYEG